MLYHDGTTWRSLAKGAALQVLRQNAALTAPGWSTAREVLTADRTYYVRTDGNDSNTGLVGSAAGAFLTYARAKAVARTIDINGHVLTIQMGAGTWTDPISLFDVVGYWGSGSCILLGDTSTPSNVIISPTNTNAISADGISTVWRIKGFKVQTTTSGWGVYLTRASALFYNMEFGACASGHILAICNSYLYMVTSYTINGAAPYHVYVTSASTIVASNITITHSGTLEYTYFAVAGNLGFLNIYGNTFTGGTITGARYIVNANSVIFTNGGGAGYLPGNSSGSFATGGQYI
jgi:hypothetical protein